MVELYQMEHCPYCAKVRMAMEEMDIDFIARNVPKGSLKRKFLVALGGKEQEPFLVDTDNPAAPVTMYESDDIISYLKEKYAR